MAQATHSIPQTRADERQHSEEECWCDPVVRVLHRSAPRTPTSRPTSDPAWRSWRARQGAIAMHAKNDVMVVTAPGRAAAEARFGSPEERAAYFRDITQRSVVARRLKRQP